MTRNVQALCAQCLRPVDAEVFARDGKAVLRKYCPEHGGAEVVIDSDAEAYEAMFARSDRYDQLYHLGVTCAAILNVTDRCNLSCRNCYHPVDMGAEDPSIESIVDLARKTYALSIILMGAEPTMRDDLGDLIREIKAATPKPVLIYTNGVKLADPAYVDSLQGAGLDAVCLSLHTAAYNGPQVYARKEAALEAIKSAGLPVHHLSFTIANGSDMHEVAQAMRRHWGQPHHFRIRCASPIGRSQRPMFPSEFARRVSDGFRSVGWSNIEVRSGDNSPCHLNLNVEGRHVRVIRWPSVEECVLDDLGPWPSAFFLPEAGELNFVHAALLQSHGADIAAAVGDGGSSAGKPFDAAGLWPDAPGATPPPGFKDQPLREEA